MLKVQADLKFSDVDIPTNKEKSRKFDACGSFYLFDVDCSKPNYGKGTEVFEFHYPENQDLAAK